jgi:hypothetical protein
VELEVDVEELRPFTTEASRKKTIIHPPDDSFTYRSN